MAVAFVRHSRTAGGTGTTSPLSVTITGAASGNVLIAIISSNRGSSAARTVSGITTTNTTWTQIGTLANGSAAVYIWQGLVAGGTSGTAVSISFSGTVASGCVADICEFSGVLVTGTIAGATAVTNSGTSTSPTTGNFTPLQADSLVVAALSYENSTAPSASPGAPWVTGGAVGFNSTGTSSDGVAGVHQAPIASISTTSASWTIGATGDVWSTAIVELRGQTLTLSVNDTATITESVTMQELFLPSVNDAVSHTENSTAPPQIVALAQAPNIFDTDTLTESLQIAQAFCPNVHG